ncbi:bis(5'-nucleosyl)-tetraphosphatase (symmetrical) YqeK [Lyngbya confervoides]|uniref:bis(5'-nucleosyl)-tetraphosphatase (symmetrical) n=1 Tax=Lyngbya confervoides BDU141951 TaxID=1574623 RepID=A0ABD4T2M5_9CYAN|nr:bis(5'-nucleosyl)-tetraphosphatase (symmetrical) YqeK [Lyngbya confervoides]MCM1982663.1 bis(5'-nucleosyl)-tetraphosphatase (symmetrical) YqeK [Lyngbya confervoides BDU141951]
MNFLDRDRVLTWLYDHLPQRRVDHILRVEQVAEDLALVHGVDPEKSRQAGLLHDLAKFYPPDTLLSTARQQGHRIHPVEQAHPHLLHAWVSAVEANRLFGVESPEILAAIRNHTLGCPGMDALSGIIFLADALEPGRGEGAKLNQIRAWSQQNWHKAVWKTCDHTLKQLLKAGQMIHPQMLETRNWAMAQAKLKKDDKLESLDRL